MYLITAGCASNEWISALLLLPTRLGSNIAFSLQGVAQKQYGKYQGEKKKGEENGSNRCLLVFGISNRGASIFVKQPKMSI